MELDFSLVPHKDTCIFLSEEQQGHADLSLIDTFDSFMLERSSRLGFTRSLNCSYWEFEIFYVIQVKILQSIENTVIN